MPKKMFDIVPPKVANKLEDTLKEMGATNKKRTTTSRGVSSKMVKPSPKKFEAPVIPPAIPRKEQRFPLKEILAGVGVVAFLLIVYGVTKLPKADIQIWPTTDIMTLSEKITADTSVKSVDIQSNVIPARYLEEEKEESQEFLATGSASNEGKATGSIRIYNKTTSAFSLLKGTHFLSDSGKYFVTLSKVSIPAATKNSPGSVLASVQAQESGTEYNIGPSKFSVPKLSGTAYYYSIYAESSSDMTGGYTGKVKKVTDEDIRQAKETLTKRLLEESKNSLKSKIAEDEVLLDGAIESIIVDSSADVKAGTVVDKFNQKAKVKTFALVFKKQDAKIFVADDIKTRLEKEKNYLPESVTIDYTIKSFDDKKGILGLELASSVKTYYSIDKIDLVNLFANKSGDQIKEVIDQMQEGRVSQLKVNFWPFWVHKAPDDKDKINVDLIFE